MVYVFMSFASAHTGKNIGCCIVRVKKAEDANAKCKELGLMPKECNNARGSVLDDEDFPKQGMELDRFYSRQEMIDMGFEKD